MLTLKNTLAAKPVTHSEPPVPSTTHPVAAAEAAVKGRQLLRGRTRVKVETLKGEVESARVRLDELRRTKGEHLLDELPDVMSDTQAVEQAENHLCSLQAMLAVAIERDQQAQDSLRDAENLAKLEATAAACAHVIALGPRGEEIIAAAKQFAKDLALAADALRLAGGNEKFAYGANKIVEHWGFFLKLSTTGHVHPDRLMEHKTWTACVEARCGLKARDE